MPWVGSHLTVVFGPQLTEHFLARTSQTLSARSLPCLVHNPRCLLACGPAITDRFDALCVGLVQLGVKHAMVDHSRSTFGLAPRLSNRTGQEHNPSQNGYPGLRLHPDFPPATCGNRNNNESVTDNGPVVVYRTRILALFSTSVKSCRVHAGGKVSLDAQVIGDKRTRRGSLDLRP